MNNALTAFNPLGKRLNIGGEPWYVTTFGSLVQAGSSYLSSNNNLKASQANAEAQIKLAEAQKQASLTQLEISQITAQANKDLAIQQSQDNQKLALYGLGALVFIGGLIAFFRK